MNERLLIFLVLLMGCLMADGTAANRGWAFDYEHPEKLSAGDCWVTLTDGRVVIRSGRDCPRSRPAVPAPESESESEPFWNNVGRRSAVGTEPAVPEGNSAGGSADMGTDSPWIPGAPYYRGCGRPLGDGHHGHRDGHAGPGHPPAPAPHPVRNMTPPLPPDQLIFQKIYKNVYPAMNNNTTGSPKP